jgi:glutamate-1-semialdehyde 2,1-aminomutase
LSYPDDSPKSAALYQRALKSLPGGNTRTTVYFMPFPLYAQRGKGCRVWDVDGASRIDCINNFTAGIHGYGHPAITEAVSRQLSLGTAFGMPTSSEIDLAELLCERVPSVERVRFMNSGTEAVMMALKAARARTGRSKIAKCEGAYHGSYDYAEVSLDPSPATWGENRPVSVAYAQGTPRGVLDDVIVIPFNDADAAAELLRPHRADLAAILVDPMPSRAGLAPADPAFIQSLRALADDSGSLLIFDEVISFRLGYNGAQTLWGTRADLTCFGKIIGGGFPVGAVGGRADVMSVFDPRSGKPVLPHGGTFSANPVTMSAGLASMQLLTPTAFAHLQQLGDQLRTAVTRQFRAKGIAGGTTGGGSLLQIYIGDRHIRDYRSAYLDADATRRMTLFFHGLLDHGVLAASNGLMALSTAMTGADIEAVSDTVGRALEYVR